MPSDIGLTGAFPTPGTRSDLPVFLLAGIMYLSSQRLIPSFTSLDQSQS